LLSINCPSVCHSHIVHNVLLNWDKFELTASETVKAEWYIQAQLTRLRQT